MMTTRELIMRNMTGSKMYARGVQALLLSALCFSGGHASASSFDVLLLQGLGGTQTRAEAINNAGQIVGSGTTPGNLEPSALMWSAGMLTNLGQLVSPSSSATGINNAGQVVGRHAVSSFWESAATVWAAGSATDLTSPASGVRYAWATGINDQGMVVGGIMTSDYWLTSVSRAVVWTSGTLQVLPGIDPLSNGTDSGALALNNSGQVAGYVRGAVTGWDQRAVVWQAGQMQVLDTLGGTSSSATAINDLGTTVGWSATGSAVHATLWAGTSATDLGALGGAAASFAMGINELGQVVGFSGDSLFGNNSRATLWSAGEIIDLSSLLPASLRDEGWYLARAMDINDAGQIVGVAVNATTQEERAFLLSPLAAVPEPPPAALMLGSALLFLIRRQRSKH